MMVGTLIILTASAACGTVVAGAQCYLVIASPMQAALPRPITLMSGFDPMACGLRVMFSYGGKRRVGVLLRDGRVLSSNTIYTPDAW